MAGLSIWKKMEVLSSAGKQNSCRHDPERERGTLERARRPLAIAAFEDFMTSICMSHCQTSWVREKMLSLGKDFILARYKGGNIQIPEAAGQILLTAKLPSVPSSEAPNVCTA